MNIAIVGASGAVGQEFMRVLDEQDFPFSSLTLFGSSRSAGREYEFRGKKLVVKELTKNPEDFRDIKIAFVSAGAGVSKEYADTITKYGCIMIDNSSAFRMDPMVPLVVPEVNGEDALFRPKKIISNPNCTTIQMLIAVNPIYQVSPIEKIHVATYQAASGAGATAMAELVQQHKDIVEGREPKVEKFVAQLAYNLIPQVDVFVEDDYTKEEMKMYNETRKILHDNNIKVSATCVRVPVLRSHSEAIWLETRREVSPREAREALQQAPGVVVIDNPAKGEYPMPYNLAGKDPVYVGRIRKDLTNEKGLLLWAVGDQIKKGAALNAVQIAQWLLANDPTVK